MGKPKEDKDWAKRYILDPLTAPEPNQLDGPGSSFFNPRRSLSLNCKPKTVPPHSHQRRHNGGYPAQPSSASPTRATFQIHHPKPISPGRRHSYLPPTDWTPAEVVLRLGHSVEPSSQTTTNPERSKSWVPSAQRPNREVPASKEQPPRRKPLSTQHPTTATAVPVRPTTTKLSKTAPKTEEAGAPPEAPPKTEARFLKPVPSPRPNKPKVGRKPPQTHHTQGTAEILGEILADTTTSYINRPLLVPTQSSAPPSPPKNAKPTKPPTLHRRGSFVRKASGEMAYKAPAAAAPASAPTSTVAPEGHRSSSHRKHYPRSNRPVADTIDSLDQIGGIYHHGGPYDATLAAVNANKKKSPLEAVKGTNLEALKATPREYIQDSLTKHVPLQGTSIVPPGMPDRNGHVMYYEEGADLMREPDAPGGPYRRYDFIQYHPDDLKGKGEPSFSIERALKENKSGKLRKRSSSFSPGQVGGYEMQDQSYRRGHASGSDAPLLPSKGRDASVRRQSLSHGSSTGASPGNSSSSSGRPDYASYGSGNDAGLARSSSGSHRFSDGIKRRLGSLRRK